ncbi:MAG: hypothetical protein IPO35_17325 [Uliginosibacterium sp.]|jgi:hypothetical protein|nr:hypothetical protein [Uliginosibacterium sp.]MBK9617175.1 hypothetical protein [Uliginosibacterium sp.]
MSIRNKPLRWQGSDEAIKAVQIAFDVEEAVLQAVRRAAFDNNLSTPDQIRQILALPLSSRPKRPRLTVSLGPEDYVQLAERYGLNPDDRLRIKERVTMDLIDFAKSLAP